KHKPSCLDKCTFDDKCETTQYIQYSPCSYACVCDDQYTYYEDPDFKQCGTEKRCYQGQCIDEVYNRCNRDYGDYFIGLLNQGNPCSYNCYDSHKPCNVYEEYFPDGVSCYTSNTLGQCIERHCVIIVRGKKKNKVTFKSQSGPAKPLRHLYYPLSFVGRSAPEVQYNSLYVLRVLARILQELSMNSFSIETRKAREDSSPVPKAFAPQNISVQ
ncbi:egg case silk protein-1, partial [Trichonephila clavata]